jgi:hypothetical protein
MVAKVEMKPVASSNLAASGYDPASSTMYIRFRGGELYAYKNVPLIVYLGLAESASKGEFLKSQIIPYFACSKVAEESLNQSTTNKTNRLR